MRDERIERERRVVSTWRNFVLLGDDGETSPRYLATVSVAYELRRKFYSTDIRVVATRRSLIGTKNSR